MRSLVTLLACALFVSSAWAKPDAKKKAPTQAAQARETLKLMTQLANSLQSAGRTAEAKLVRQFRKELSQDGISRMARHEQRGAIATGALRNFDAIPMPAPKAAPAPAPAPPANAAQPGAAKLAVKSNPVPRADQPQSTFQNLESGLTKPSSELRITQAGRGQRKSFTMTAELSDGRALSIVLSPNKLKVRSLLPDTNIGFGGGKHATRFKQNAYELKLTRTRPRARARRAR